MCVVSSLDCLILGDPQILGKIKKAFTRSQPHQIMCRDLKRLFQKSFSVAKRVQTETDIGVNAVSFAFAACSLARRIFESLSEVTILLIRAEETIELMARHLFKHKVNVLLLKIILLKRHFASEMTSAPMSSYSRRYTIPFI